MTAPFQEKSAIGSLLIMLLALGYYAHSAWGSQLSRGETIGLIVGVTILIVIAEIIYHVAIAVLDRVDTDERDRLIDARAERIAGLALASGVVGTIWYTLFHESSIATVHWLVVSLCAAEVIKRASQIVYYHRAAT